MLNKVLWTVEHFKSISVYYLYYYYYYYYYYLLKNKKLLLYYYTLFNCLNLLFTLKKWSSFSEDKNASRYSIKLLLLSLKNIVYYILSTNQKKIILFLYQKKIKIWKNLFTAKKKVLFRF